MYALNCDKSMWLKNMIQPRLNPYCLYHDRFYQLIVAGDSQLNGMEMYDINKDKWRMIIDILDFDKKLQNMWISKINPNIIFQAMLQTKSFENIPYPMDYVEIKRIDLRMDMNNPQNNGSKRNCVTIWNSLEHQFKQHNIFHIDDEMINPLLRRFGCAHICL